MSILGIETAPAFEPLLAPSRYKGAWGGRGSGKSHFFAGKLIEDAMCDRGLLAVCIREVQKSLADSSKRLIEKKLADFGLGEAQGFKVYREVIRTPGDGVIAFHGLNDHTAESIKSLEGFSRAWCEEAQTISAGSLALLRADDPVAGIGIVVFVECTPQGRSGRCAAARNRNPDRSRRGQRQLARQ